MSTITNEVNHDKQEKTFINSPEFKAKTLKLAQKEGVAAAERQLSLHESWIYSWRKAKPKNCNISHRQWELAVQVAKRKSQLTEQAEELEIVRKAAAYFAKIWNKCYEFMFEQRVGIWVSRSRFYYWVESHYKAIQREAVR